MVADDEPSGPAFRDRPLRVHSAQEGTLRKEETIKAEEIARNATEIAELEGELERAKFEIEINLARIRKLNRQLSAQESALVASANARENLSTPGPSADQQRLEALKNTVSQANLLAKQLSEIGA